MKVRITEAQVSLLRESINYEGLKDLIVSGQEENIELAYSIGAGQGINVDELVKSIYGGLLDLVIGKYDEDNTFGEIKYKIIPLIEIMNSTELDFSKDNLDYPLKSLPESIGKLKKLKVLDLEGNKLKKLPESIGNLENLELLDLVGNPISNEEKFKIEKLLPNTKVIFNSHQYLVR